MNKYSQIRVTDPCGEHWDNMQPSGEGRFCSSCLKTVVDFTAMSDREILSWLSGTDRSVCGRFMEDQLGRNLSAVVEGRKWRIWNFLLAGLLLSSKAPAQIRAPRPPVGQHDNAPLKEDILMVGEVQPYSPTGRITGKVVGSASGEPVAGASIAVGKELFVADGEGRFSIPAAKVRWGMKVVVTSVGYQQAGFVVHKRWLAGEEQILTLSPSVMGLTAVTVKGYNSTVNGKMMLTCTTTTTTIFRDTLAFLGISKKRFGIYPNPVARGAAVTLSISGGRPGAWLVQLFSGSGLLVESMEVQGGESARVELMNIPASLAAGVYFIKIAQRDGDKAYTKELVVL